MSMHWYINSHMHRNHVSTCVYILYTTNMSICTGNGPNDGQPRPSNGIYCPASGDPNSFEICENRTWHAAMEEICVYTYIYIYIHTWWQVISLKKAFSPHAPQHLRSEMSKAGAAALAAALAPESSAAQAATPTRHQQQQQNQQPYQEKHQQIKLWQQQQQHYHHQLHRKKKQEHHLRKSQCYDDDNCTETTTKTAATANRTI